MGAINEVVIQDQWNISQGTQRNTVPAKCVLSSSHLENHCSFCRSPWNNKVLTFKRQCHCSLHCCCPVKCPTGITGVYLYCLVIFTDEIVFPALFKKIKFQNCSLSVFYICMLCYDYMLKKDNPLFKNKQTVIFFVVATWE